MAKKSRRRHQPAARQAAARRAPRPVQPSAGAGSGAATPYTPTTLEDVLDEAEVEADAPEAAEAPAAAPSGAVAAAAPTQSQARRVGRVGRVEPALAGARGRRGPSSGSATFPPLDPDDAAIPFDRVPYVRADLRRVAMIAGIMVVLIAIADVIVSTTVK